MQKNIIVVGVVALLIGIAGGYFGGQALTPKRPAGEARGVGANGQFRQATSGPRNTFGQIQDINADRLTLKTRDGSSQIILLTSDTTYEKTASATQSDFQTGASVVINGKANPDGSVTATSVQTAPTNFGQNQGRPFTKETPNGKYIFLIRFLVPTTPLKTRHPVFSQSP